MLTQIPWKRLLQRNNLNNKDKKAVAYAAAFFITITESGSRKETSVEV